VIPTYINHAGLLFLFYLQHPFVEISNNASERSIKPWVLSRRNCLFADSEEGGQTAATIMSVIETCKRLQINPSPSSLARVRSSILWLLQHFRISEMVLKLTKELI
jgi:hypothetical protein